MIAVILQAMVNAQENRKVAEGPSSSKSSYPSSNFDEKRQKVIWLIKPVGIIDYYTFQRKMEMMFILITLSSVSASNIIVYMI
jgi:hypothetical protein